MRALRRRLTRPQVRPMPPRARGGASASQAGLPPRRSIDVVLSVRLPRRLRAGRSSACCTLAPLSIYTDDAIRIGRDELETKDVYEVHTDAAGMVTHKILVDKLPLPNRRSVRDGADTTGSIGRLEQLTLGQHRALRKPVRVEQIADMPTREEDPFVLKAKLEARRADQEKMIKDQLMKDGMKPRSTGMDDRAGTAGAGDTVAKARVLQKSLGYDLTSRRHAARVPAPTATKQA